MQNGTHIVLVGATSAIAEHCARLWLAEKPAMLTLVGRNPERLERLATDLRIRGPQSEINILVCDLLDTESIRTTVAATLTTAPLLVLIAQGNLPAQADCETDLQLCRDTLEINAVSPVLFAQAYATHMCQAGQGTLVLLGSVAGDRGRKSNYVYGAGKGLVDRYAQGLQHRCAGSAVRIVLVKPGPTDTPMTAQLKARGYRLASVESVAEQIVRAIERGKSVVYAPRRWALVMLVVRHLPRFIFNRLDI